MIRTGQELSLVRNNQDGSGMIRTGQDYQDWSGMIRIGQDWSGVFGQVRIGYDRSGQDSSCQDRSRQARPD